MDSSEIVTLIVATLSFVAALGAQRQSARASKNENQIAANSSRMELETEAYIRARAFDAETIERQKNELASLRSELKDVEAKHDELELKYSNLLEDNRRLKDRVSDLEKHELDSRD